MLVLLIILFFLAVVSGVWLRINAYEQRYQLLELRAEQLAGIYGQIPESNIPAERFHQDDAFRSGQFLVQIADHTGRIQTLKKDSRDLATDYTALNELSGLHGMVLEGKIIREKVEVSSQTWLRVGVPIYREETVAGALYVSMPAKGVHTQVRHLYISLALLFGIVALAGWLVLYFLSRRLTRPLREVAAAAKSIAGGEYDLVLPEQVKERELQQLIGSFSDMAAQLKQLEQLRTDLLAGVSHELRTPITSIRGMIQAIRDKVVTGEEAEEFLKISLNESKRLQGMVEDLLDFSSLEAGAAPLNKETVDLSYLVDEVIQQLCIIPEYSHIQFVRDLPDVPVWVDGDAGRLRQILINLLNNSQKASATSIRLTLRVNRGLTTLDVQDNGRGIAGTEQPYVFERFYRGGVGQAKARGLGLGLTISRLLARAHGGDLTLLHSSTEGATLRLDLPVLQRQDNRL